jgi:hypothetical protein
MDAVLADQSVSERIAYRSLIAQAGIEPKANSGRLNLK